VTDWAHGLPWTSLFSIADMCYQKDGKLDMNHKGLLEVDCTTKTVVRPKAAYFAVQHLTAIIDHNVSSPNITWVHTADGAHITRVDAPRDGASLVLLWFNEGMPSGNTTFATGTSSVEINLADPMATFSDPVVVDLVSGAVVDATQCAGTAQCAVPVYDAPTLLTERELVPIGPTPSSAAWRRSQ